MQFDYSATVNQLDSITDANIPVPKRMRDRIVEYYGSKRVDPHGTSTGMRLSLLWGDTRGNADVKKDSLVEWLNDAAREPCHCGSGKYYEKCHAEDEVPAIVARIVRH